MCLPLTDEHSSNGLQALLTITLSKMPEWLDVSYIYTYVEHVPVYSNIENSYHAVTNTHAHIYVCMCVCAHTYLCDEKDLGLCKKRMA